jgi:hypothetical protein
LASGIRIVPGTSPSKKQLYSGIVLSTNFFSKKPQKTWTCSFGTLDVSSLFLQCLIGQMKLLPFDERVRDCNIDLLEGAFWKKHIQFHGPGQCSVGVSRRSPFTTLISKL